MNLFDDEVEEIDIDEPCEDANNAIMDMSGSHGYYLREGIMRKNKSMSSEEALGLATVRQAELTNEFKRRVIRFQVELYKSSACREYIFEYFFDKYDSGESVAKFSSRFNNAVKGLNVELAEELLDHMLKARDLFHHGKIRKGVRELILANLSHTVFYGTEMMEVLNSAAEDGDPHANKALTICSEIKETQEEMLSICYSTLTKLISDRVHGLLIAKGTNSRESSSLQFCDLFQHLCEELVKASFRYDRKGFSDKNASWSSYAYAVAFNQLNTFIIENTRLVSVDRAVLARSNFVREASQYRGTDSYEKIAEVANKLLIRNKGEITDKEKFTAEEVEGLLLFTGSGNPISLDTSVGTDDENKDVSFGESFGDEAAMTEEIYDLKNIMEKIRDKLKSVMSEEEWEVISLRYHLNTDEGILGIGKLSQEKVVFDYLNKYPHKKMHKNKVKIIEDRIVSRIRDMVDKDKEWAELLHASLELESNPMFRNKVGVLSLSELLNRDHFYLARKDLDNEV